MTTPTSSPPTANGREADRRGESVGEGSDHERIALAVSASSEGLWDWDLRTNEMYLSPRWKALCGYEDYELPNSFETWARLLHPADVQATTAALVDFIEGRAQAYHVEFRQQHRDHSYRWILAQGTALRDEQGRAYRAAGSHTDITARRQAEVERDRFFTLSRDPLCVAGADGRIQRVNPAFEQLLGWSQGEAAGMAYQDLVHPEDGPSARTLVDPSRPHLNFDNRFRGRNGAYRWLSWSTVTSEDGLVYAIGRDVTDRKDAERELQRARDLALESARLKSEFLANMSHEIRTPMNGVIGMSELLRDTRLDPEQRQYVEAITGSAQALLVVINDILDFSKIEAGKLNLDHTHFDPRGCVDDVLELLAERAEAKRLVLSADVGKTVPRLVDADAGRLRQILMNLVGNAIKFTAEGEVGVRVDAGEEHGGETELSFEVYDTGIGLSEEAQSRLFRPFVQADGSTTRRYGGTGLGLVICQRLCRLMGGDIRVSSVPGSGSTFSFSMKVNVPAQPVEETAVDRATVLAAGVRTLFVSSDRVRREALRRQLRGLGLRPEFGLDRDDAARKLWEARQSDQPFGLVLVELTPEDRDGPEVLRSLRQGRGDDLRLGATPVILLAGWRQGPRLAATGALPFARCLTLPVRQERLAETLCVLLPAPSSAATTESDPPGPPEVLAFAQSAPDAPPTSAAPPNLAGAPAARAAGPLSPRNSPVAAARPNDATLTGEPPTASEAAAPRMDAADGPHVLLAEDNVVNQQVAIKLLQRLGCRVTLAVDGALALRSWESEHFDLVFMDCQMPNLDGFEATRELRRREAGGAHIPVVAMTANAMTGDRERCLEAGMDDYMSKPISRAELERVLTRWAPAGRRRQAAS